MVLQISCSGSPYEIGLEHGRIAHKQVRGSIAFYADLFADKCSLSWPEVRNEAKNYLEHISQSCPRYVEEMRGVADGVNAASSTPDGRPLVGKEPPQNQVLDVLDVVALNVRSEIVFGLFTPDSDGTAKVQDAPLDGCTSIGLIARGQQQQHTYVAQNWDWQVGQRENLIVLQINSDDHGIPAISMVTEGGIIGKIGFNSAGVGICQNAIRARGVDVTNRRLPVHLAMRKVLECSSRKEAVGALEWYGVAGSVYLLVGDGDDSVSGVECTSTTVKVMQPWPSSPTNELEVLAHTNHLLLEHPGVEEPQWLDDSRPRVQRIAKLAGRIDGTKLESGQAHAREELLELFKDEESYPCSINRHETGKSTFETLFTIVMNLTDKNALVTFGRPSAYFERVELSF